MLAAFAGVSAVQAGDNADKGKAASADQAKATCAASACCAKETKAKARVVSKTPPRGAMLLVQR